jgi:hypothetical protein
LVTEFLYFLHWKEPCCLLVSWNCQAV